VKKGEEEVIKFLQDHPEGRAFLHAVTYLGCQPLSAEANRKQQQWIDHITVNGIMQIYQSTLARPDGAKLIDTWMANIVAEDNRNDEFIRAFVGELIYRDESVPGPLKEYLVQPRETPPPPSKNPGPDPADRIHRDAAICSTIGWLEHEHKILPTRGREQRKRESGCSIVAKALTFLGRGVSEEAVEKIWQNRRPKN
jgi:hypothetical protein